MVQAIEAKRAAEREEAERKAKKKKSYRPLAEVALEQFNDSRDYISPSYAAYFLGRSSVKVAEMVKSGELEPITHVSTDGTYTFIDPSKESVRALAVKLGRAHLLPIADSTGKAA